MLNYTQGLQYAEAVHQLGTGAGPICSYEVSATGSSHVICYQQAIHQ